MLHVSNKSDHQPTCTIFNLFLFMLPFPDSLLAAHGVTSSEGPHNDKASGLIAQFRAFSDVLTRFQTLRVDATEYACLKALVLFKSGKCHESSKYDKSLNLISI